MTDDRRKPTILCISSYAKGQPFIEEVARLDVTVVLLTTEKLAHADWPRASISRIVTDAGKPYPHQVLNTVTYLARLKHASIAS